jgi:tryptophan-rich sensory protein
MEKESGGWRWPLVSLVGLIATVTVNGLANALPLNGQATGDIINRDPVYFLPAGWVFSIWGLIYLALVAFVAYGLMPAGRRDPRIQRLGPPFLLTCAANCTWLFLWHWERLPLSMVVMVGLLLALIACYGIAHAERGATSFVERVCLRFPFSLYLGWVSVATIANATVTLDRAGWGGWGMAPELWAAIMIAVGAALAALIGIGRNDPVYAAVFVWAFVGIAVRQRDTALVAWAALIFAAAAAVVALIALARAASAARTPHSHLSPAAH